MAELSEYEQSLYNLLAEGSYYEWSEGGSNHSFDVVKIEKLVSPTEIHLSKKDGKIFIVTFKESDFRDSIPEDELVYGAWGGRRKNRKSRKSRKNRKSRR